MTLKLFFYLLVLPRVSAIFKAFLKPIEPVSIATTDIIGLLHPEKISTFISIGANDGKKNDPLYPYIKKNNWKGVMVEPMPNNFEILEKNLSSYPDIKPLNVAVTDKPGQLDFYYLKDIKDQEPDWYDQVGSLDKATFYKNISVCPELENRVGITQIECLTFDEVARKNSLAKVDLIMIDTEGYDYNILATIDLQKYQPRILIFEYEWLTNYEMKLAKKKLADANYKILLNGQDCIAYKNN